MSKLRASVPLLVVTLCALDCTVDRAELSGGLGRDTGNVGASSGNPGGSAGGGTNGGAASINSHPGAVAGSSGANGGGNPATPSGGAASSGGEASSAGAFAGAGSFGSSGASAGAGGTSSAGANAGGTSSGGTSSAGANAAGASAAGAGGTSATLLPFAVDTYFSASALGDAGSVQIQAGAGNCRPNAMASAGRCWRVDFDAKGASAASGYLWQYPANNTGQSPGLRIEAGAKQVVLSATGDKGGEQVTFFVGGAGTAATAYRDAFRVEKGVTLTTSAQTVTLDLSGASYTNVIGGFGFTVAPGADSVRFYISGIQWTK